MYTLKELCDKAYQELLDYGLSKKSIEGSNRYIWNRLIHQYGEDAIFKEEMVYNYCNEYFGKDIFNVSRANLSKTQYVYTLAFSRLIASNNNVKLQKKDFHYYRDAKLSSNSQKALDDYIQYSTDEGNSQATLNNKQQRIKRFMLDVDFDNISVDKVKVFLATEKSKYTLQAYNIAMRLIRRFLEFAYNKRYVSKDILVVWPSNMKSMKDKNIPSVYSISEIQDLLSFARSEMVEDNHLRNFAILNLIVFTGIRASDAAKLKLVDIDWRTDEISIIQSKTKKEIRMPLVPEIGNALLDYILNERKGDSKNVFLKEDGTNLDSVHITNIINNYFRSSPIDIKDRHYGPHSLRHSLATNLINKSVDAFSVANVLGHSDLDCVKIYAKVDLNNLRKCVLEAPYETIS